MREIKFRAWDKRTKEMIGWKKLSDEEVVYFFEMDMQNDKIFQQFTGLEDKNGKEIFEGDIVIGVDTNGIKRKATEVTIKQGNTYFNNDWAFSILSDIRDLEVIGNIYENPELLNGCVEDNQSAPEVKE